MAEFSADFRDKHLQLCGNKYDPEKVIDQAVARLRDRRRAVNTLVAMQDAQANALLGAVDTVPNPQWGSRRPPVSVAGLVCYGLTVIDSRDKIEVYENPSLLVAGYFDSTRRVRIVNHLGGVSGGVLKKTVSIRYTEDFPALGSPMEKKTS